MRTIYIPGIEKRVTIGNRRLKPRDKTLNLSSSMAFHVGGLAPGLKLYGNSWPEYMTESTKQNLILKEG